MEGRGRDGRIRRKRGMLFDIFWFVVNDVYDHDCGSGFGLVFDGDFCLQVESYFAFMFVCASYTLFSLRSEV